MKDEQTRAREASRGTRGAGAGARGEWPITPKNRSYLSFFRTRYSARLVGCVNVDTHMY